MLNGKLYFVLVVLLILALFAGPPAAYAARQDPVRVIVGFVDPAGEEARQLIESMGGQVIFQYHLIPAIAAVIPAQAEAELKSNPMVSYVERELHRIPENHIIPGEIWTGEPEILPWGVDRVKATQVWDTDSNLAVDSGAIAGQGARVAVLDTGLDTTHPDLAANVDFGASFDFIDNDADVSDIPGPVTGHGTSTSGIVAAIDNSIGVIGVAPYATVIMYRVCDSALNDCPDSAIIAGLEASVDNEADVVSMSFGDIGFSQALKDAVKAVSDAGLLQVASAGNTPSPIAGARHYPSGFAEVIAVGATDINDELASFSTFGGHQELVAPGVETPTTTIQGLGRDVALSEISPTPRDLDPNPMAFSGTGTLTEDLVDAGLGRASDFGTVDCTGKIALIQRGQITFRLKVENAVADGCLAAIIYNNQPGNFFGTLGVLQLIPAVSLSDVEGLALKAELDDVSTVTVDLAVVALDYDTFSGTSASAPHVSGVAALVFSANPTLSADEVRNILKGTAVDLGEPGRDNRFGWGLVDAYAAIQCATGITTCELP